MSLNGALGMGFVFEARDLATETITKLREGLGELKEAGEKAHTSILGSLSGVGMAAAAAGAAVAIAAGASFELAEHAERFSGAILNAGVAAHATREEIEGLEKFAKEKALDSLGKSAIDVAETLQELAREGFNVKESMSAVDSTMKLMRFSTLGARDAASLVHDTIAEFGMRADQSAELVDKLAFAMREFHFRAEELRPAMAGLASGAHLANASFDDTLIGVGILKDAFPNATKAAMAMNVALQQLSSTNTQKELKGIGVSVRDASGHIRPLLDIIQDLSSKTAHMTEAQLAHKLATIGSARAAGGLSVIIDQLRKGTADANGEIVTGGAALDVYRAKLAGTQGTASILVDLLGESLGGAVLRLKNAISNVGTEIGSGLEKPFANAINTVTLFVKGLTQLFSQGGFSGDVMKELDKTKNEGLQGFLIGIYVWVNRIKNFFSSLADSFGAAFAPFMPVIDAIGDRLRTVGQLLGITSQSADQNASAFDAAGNVGATLGSTLGVLAGIISNGLLIAVDFVTLAVGGMAAAWEAVGPVVMNVFQILKGAAGIIGSIFTGDWKMLWNGFVDIVAGAGKIVTNIILGVIKLITGAIDSISSMFGIKLDTTGYINKLQSEQEEAFGKNGFTVNAFKAGANPGVAASTQKVAAAAAAEPNMSVAPAEQHITVHANLHVDGEKIGTSVAKARRSSDARSFMPVHAAEGAF